MKANELLQVIFSFFLGLVVVAFVGIGVNTFYPQPAYQEWTSDFSMALETWRLWTGVILLACATVTMVVSLIPTDRLLVLTNGVLMGGVFTMIYAVGMTISAGQSVIRFVVVSVALAVTVGVGYLKFVGRRKAGAPAVDWSATGGRELVERVGALEHKLDALGRALRD